ncbi:MAG TPA: hypothetical protein VK923_01140 [Euzebyales bacterium]|nr:hypothetical protein [Euzebyales bacterium]
MAAVLTGVVVGVGLVVTFARSLHLDALTGGVPATVRADGTLAGTAALVLLVPIAGHDDRGLAQPRPRRGVRPEDGATM